MKRVEAYEYDGELYKTERECLSVELRGLCTTLSCRFDRHFDATKTISNKQRVIEILQRL